MKENEPQVTLDILKKRIGGCFGSSDLIFAEHPFDENEAKELRELAFKKKITLSEIEKIALTYLKDKNCSSEHIQEQMTEIRSFFGKKIK